jgi:hypothetical protein
LPSNPASDYWQDKTGAKQSMYLGFKVKDGEKAPACQLLLETLHTSLDVAIAAMYEANQSSLYAMKR